MKRIIVLVSACIAVSACSGFQTERKTEFVPAQEIPPPPELYSDRRQPADEAPPEISGDVDDYRWDGGAIIMPGEKQIRQLEIEKIHRLAKECIRANHTSKACNDIIALDAEFGKTFINQALRPFRR